MGKIAIVITAILGLGVLAGIICIMSFVPAGHAMGWNMENVWALAKGVGMTIAIGGLMILILALACVYNRPDNTPPPN